MCITGQLYKAFSFAWTGYRLDLDEFNLHLMDKTFTMSAEVGGMGHCPALFDCAPNCEVDTLKITPTT